MKEVIKKIKQEKLIRISEIDLFYRIEHIDFTATDLDYLFNELEKVNIEVYY